MKPLLDFLTVARSAGVSFSPAESIVAVQAAALVGYDDRTALKDSLGLVLAKTAHERKTFDACFERYFGRDATPLPPSEPAASLAGAVTDPGVRAAIAASSLATTLLDDDRAMLVRDLHAAALRAGAGEICLFTQAGIVTRRLLVELGIEKLDAAIARLHEIDHLPRLRAAQFLAERRRAVVELARDLVERRLAARGPRDAERLHDRFLREVRLANVDRRDLERMRSLVAEMARRLVVRQSRVQTRARRGRLDVRRTLRRNAGFDGVPFRLTFKARPPRKPRIVVLCDVSGSVAALAQFLLLFVSVLAGKVADVHAFAFSDSLLDVTELVANEAIETAVPTIMRAIGFRSSDYGRALGEFERDHLALVDRRTTVIILGDGRTNYGDPRVDVVRRLRDRAKRVLWLNPENRVAWGMDDSEMLRYLPYCTLARECNRLRHLEDVLEGLVRPA